jgi:hypothetical protein
LQLIPDTENERRIEFLAPGRRLGIQANVVFQVEIEILIDEHPEACICVDAHAVSVREIIIKKSEASPFDLPGTFNVIGLTAWRPCTSPHAILISPP